MYKWITAAVVGLSILASFAVMKFGLGPKSIPIIKASNFEDPAVLGQYIHRQLFPKLVISSPILFGFNKENTYEQKVVNSVIEHIKKDLKTKIPEIIFLSPEESYSGASSDRQNEIRKRYGNSVLAFTVINLKDTEEASGLINCEKDLMQVSWLECKKKQKVRQMNRGKKVDLKKPIAIVETQSQIDIMIYVRE